MRDNNNNKFAYFCVNDIFRELPPRLRGSPCARLQRVSERVLLSSEWCCLSSALPLSSAFHCVPPAAE